MSLSCDYFEGMFSHEDMPDTEAWRTWGSLCEREAAMYHEAGHAVVGYVLEAIL